MILIRIVLHTIVIEKFYCTNYQICLFTLRTLLVGPSIKVCNVFFRKDGNVGIYLTSVFSLGSLLLLIIKSVGLYRSYELKLHWHSGSRTKRCFRFSFKHIAFCLCCFPLFLYYCAAYCITFLRIPVRRSFKYETHMSVFRTTSVTRMIGFLKAIIQHFLKTCITNIHRLLRLLGILSKDPHNK